MYITTNIILFFLGGVIASFVMCLADRYGVKTMMGRSVCDDCGMPLAYGSLIPFFGAFCMCKYCHKKGGVTYLFFEIIFSITFLIIGNSIMHHTEIAQVLPYGQVIFFIIAILIISLLGFLGIFDNKHKVFPTRELLLTITISFVLFLIVVLLYSLQSISIVNQLDNIISYIKYVMVAVAWGIPFLLISLFSKEKYMGYGDGLLMIAFGLIAVSVKLFKNIVDFTTYQNIPEIMRYYFYQSITEQFLVTLLAASMIGLLWGTVHNYRVNKKITLHKQQAIPFGPPLILGFLLVLLCF